jgi:hypothetical protein
VIPEIDEHPPWVQPQFVLLEKLVVLVVSSRQVKENRLRCWLALQAGHSLAGILCPWTVDFEPLEECR